MRIVAGKKRGMNLLSPKGYVSRPITDRVKESLFNVLFNYGLPEGKVVADLFSGVGSLGLESLSRGAKTVTFVEKDPQIAAVLKKNIEKAGFVKESKIVKADAFKAGAAERQKYDIIFVDPPYPMTNDAGECSPLAGLLTLLAGQLANDGIVVVRTNERTELLQRYGSLEIIDRRKWGTMAETLLRQVGNDK